MKKPSFEDVKLDLAEACAFLRSFTLGRHGFTRQDGIAGIQRVTDQCDRMEKLFALTFVAAIVVFVAAYALSAWKSRHP